MPTEITTQFGTGSVTLPITIAGAEIVSYSEQPYQGQVAELRDENGRVVKRQQYGRGDIVEHNATVQLSCGTAAQTITVTLGGSNGCESVNVSTSNDGWPTIAMKWYTGFGTGQSALCDDGESYSETITLMGKKKAQAIDISCTGYLQSSSWAASCQFELLLDGSGAPKAYAFSGGQVSASSECYGGTLTSSTLDPFDVTENRSQTDFVSFSGSGTRTLTPASSSSSS